MVKAKSKNLTKEGVSSTTTPPRSVSLENFKAFLRAHLAKCKCDSWGGISASLPEFDLMPQDYLNYANEALATPTDANKINCIGHLKRAAECEADTFLHILSIGKLSKIKNFPAKMDVITYLDLMPSRSISQLNRIRNRIEHEYAVPEIEDLSVYFDLVAGFVSAIEGAIFMLISKSEMEFWADEDESPRVRFQLKYIAKEPEIRCAMNDGTETVFSVKPDDWDTFVETLRILFLLIRCGYIVSNDYVLKHIDLKGTI
ncbi:MAG: hypothetical protein R3C14_44375 [Caldilineaceae bacterium]